MGCAAAELLRRVGRAQRRPHVGARSSVVWMSRWDVALLMTLMCASGLHRMNSWTAFGTSVTEADLIAVADFFVSSGLRDLG